MKSSRSELPDVLALTLPEAVKRLEQSGFAVDVLETSPPRRGLSGAPRVLAVRGPVAGRVVLVASRGPDPAGVNEGG